jgi:hypothetical protein
MLQCDVPDELMQQWLQHLRDFDTAHTGCHFEVAAETDAIVPVSDMLAMLRVEPALSFIEAYKMAKR